MLIAGIDPSINGTAVYKIEVDDNMNVIGKDYIGHTLVKKKSNSKVLHFHKKDYTDNTHQNIFMQNRILDFISDCEYVAIENYAYDSTGMVFNIGEFVGGLKQKIRRDYPNIKIRLHEPTVVKIFGTGKGNCDKIRMVDEYEKYKDPNSQYDISDLPQYTSAKDSCPKFDIVDAYYICMLMRLEVMLRKGFMELKDFTPKQIQIFNRVTKANPVNLLSSPFLGEGEY